MRVFVLLFNARTENEGIHTVKVDDRNVILMFESEDDATRFGLLLEAQDFATATVEAFEVDDIEEFCQAADYECKLIAEGTLTIPPGTNLDETDWQAENPPMLPSEPASSDLSNSELEAIRRRLEGLL